MKRLNLLDRAIIEGLLRDSVEAWQDVYSMAGLHKNVDKLDVVVSCYNNLRLVLHKLLKAMEAVPDKELLAFAVPTVTKPARRKSNGKLE
jgi:hypothetical protein